MSDQPQMECPQCGEDAVPQSATEQVPWRAHEIIRPRWSHRDGSSLCPVIGPSGYEPARPQARQPGPGAQATRPLAPDRLRRKRAEDRQPAVRPPGRPADTIGTHYMRRLIASLAPAPHSPAGRRDPDREAGS
jgi:hypothetical protein